MVKNASSEEDLARDSAISAQHTDWQILRISPDLKSREDESEFRFHEGGQNTGQNTGLNTGQSTPQIRHWSPAIGMENRNGIIGTGHMAGNRTGTGTGTRTGTGTGTRTGTGTGIGNGNRTGTGTGTRTGTGNRTGTGTGEENRDSGTHMHDDGHADTDGLLSGRHSSSSRLGTPGSLGGKTPRKDPGNLLKKALVKDKIDLKREELRSEGADLEEQERQKIEMERQEQERRKIEMDMQEKERRTRARMGLLEGLRVKFVRAERDVREMMVGLDEDDDAALTHAQVCMYMYGWMDGWMDGCMYVCVCVCIYMYVCVCLCVFVCVCV